MGCEYLNMGVVIVDIRIDQYVYVGSVLAFLKPGLPQTNNYSFKSLQTSGLAEFLVRQSV